MGILTRVHVNNKPLNGQWDGKKWDRQTARCSNNFRVVALPFGSDIRWEVETVNGEDPSSISFNVKIDVPVFSDPLLYSRLKNGSETPRDVRFVVSGGAGRLYIATVDGASAPFFITVVG
jgi:hypothetical protein